MLVPRTPLLFWFALVILPTALLGAAIPAASIPAILIVAVFGLLALSDALLALNCLKGISVTLPEVVRFSKDREGVLEVSLRQQANTGKRIRIGFAFPHEIASPQDALLVALPEGSEAFRVVWPCTPHKRGRYQLDTCYLEGTSPFGWWALRGSVPVQSELRVYPDLSQERHQLAALFLNRGGFGIHAQRQMGKGREFEKLREYIPGDSFEDIHWKATAKRRHPITKVFQIERTQEVYVIVDASRLSARLTPEISPQQAMSENHTPAAILERFITAALVMGLAAQKQGDLFGVVTFSDQVQGFARAKSGKNHYSACRDMLYTLQPKIVNPDFDELCAFLRLRLRRRALLVMLTNLDDAMLAESFVKNMELIRRQHLVLVNMLRPAAAQPVFSNPAVANVDDLYRELGGHLLWHDLRELERVLHHRGVNFALLNNEKMCVDLVSQYISVKRRQVL